MTQKITILLCVAAFIATVLFVSNSAGVFAPERNAGIADTGCGDCHQGTGSGSFTITGIPASYTPGQTYSAQICITDAAKVAGGFSMYQSDFASNVFTPSDGTSYYRPGNTYLTHNGKKFFTTNDVENNNDQSCWDFTWTAPAAGAGPKGIQAAGNAVNNDGGSGSLDNGNYLVTVNSAEGALPVDLISFDADSRADRVVLYWHTAEEINNDYFSVERSYNARDFVEIAKIAGEGTTDEPTHYSFTDENVEFNRPLYYRLKQTDFDGTTDYSLIKRALVEQDEVTIDRMYPNPVFQSESVQVQFTVQSNLTSVNLTVFDMVGHEKMNREIAVVKGENTLEFSASELPAGTYFLSLNTDNQQIMSNMFIVAE